jgi:ankyrin repeat protein
MLSSTERSRYAFDNTHHTDQASEGDTQLIAGNGEMANVTPAIQTSALLGLPTEILVYLLQYLHGMATPLLLSSTCHQLRSIYQDERLYIAQEREWHRFIYMLNTPALYDALNAKLPNEKLTGVKIPDPHTSEWIQLRNHSLPEGLTQAAWQTAFIQKTYLTAWELLQTAEYKDKPYVLKLMQIIGKLSVHISNAESYAKKLFNNTFPKVWLDALIAINLDWSLQILCGHFAWREVKPFVAELDPALSTLLSEARYKSRQWQFSASILTHKPYSSFLSYALERFYLFGNQANVEFTHPDIQALLESMLADPAINYNAENENRVTLLIAACQNNREALVNRYLQHPGIDTDKQVLTGLTALDWAVKNEAVAIIQVLLAYGVAQITHVAAFNYAINLQKDKIAHTLWQQAKDSDTFIEQALIEAVAAEKSKVIYQLIKAYHANPHILPPDYSIVSVALKKRHFLLLDWLLLEPEYKLNIQGTSEKNLLHHAIELANYPQERRIQLIKRLLAEGADCNAVDEEGDTPLMRACQLEQEEIVTLLLEQPSIDICIRDDQESALVYAVRAGAFTIVEKLLTHDIDMADRVSAFNVALENTQEDIANLLLQSVKGQQDFINEALTQAIINDSPSAAYKLIKEYAANPNTVDDANSSALTVALEHEDALLFDLLLNHPDFIIDIKRNNKRKIALHYIFSMQNYSDEQLIQLTHRFIEQGGNCNLTDKEGNTPLILACQAGRKAMVELLLQQPYLNINAKNNRGDSALKCAVERGTVSTVQTLLQYEIELEDQLAAFNYAIQLKQEKLILVLRQAHGKDFINQALSWALKKGQKAEGYSATNYSFLIRQLTKEHGANPERVADFYPAAFYIALREAAQGSRDSIALLDHVLNGLALPDLKLLINKDHRGNTPLMYAVQLSKSYSYEKITQLITCLFALGVEVNAVDKKKRTALMLASESNPNLIHLLLAQSAININMKDKHGESVLDWVINKDNTTLLTELLEHQIDIDILIDAFNSALSLKRKKITKLLWQTVEQKKISIEQVFIRALAEKRFKASLVLSKLIDQYGANPGTVDEYGTSALNIALKEGEKELIDKIVQQPAFKVNLAKDPAGNTALIYAVKLQNYPEEKKLHLVKRLLEYGADYNISDTENNTPLLLACKDKEEKLAHLLLQQPLINVNVRDKKDKSALDYAIKYEMVSVIQALLTHPLTIECHLSAFNCAIKLRKNDLLKLIWQKAGDKERFANQALSWAIERAKSKAVSSIIYTLIKEYGADPNGVDKAGVSPLAVALDEEDTALLDMLLQHPKLKIDIQTKNEKGWTLLHLTLALETYPFAKQILLIERLFAHEIDCNEADKKGSTPLITLANGYNGERLLPLLLQHAPINTNARTTEGLSALDYAVHFNTVGFVQALLKYGVNTDTFLSAFNQALEYDKNEMLSILWPDVQRQEGFNNRALSLAISNNHAQAAYRLIKDYGADPNTVNALGFSPLNLALCRGNIVLLNKLLPYPDLKVNLEKDDTGNTALIYAIDLEAYAEEKRVQLIKYLLEKGADCNAANKNGTTPLIHACSFNEPELTKLLLSHAPDMNARDNEGNSALDYAVLYGTVNLIQVLLAYEVAPDTLLSAFNQAVHFKEDSMAEILLDYAKKQGNDHFVNQALARAQEKEQQEIIDILQRGYGVA